MKLNGWQRIGVIISALWFITATIGERVFEDHEIDKDVRSSEELCLNAHDEEATLAFQAGKPMPQDNCAKEATAEAMDMYKSETWFGPLFVGAAPIFLVWGMVYLIIFLTRWVRRGFQRKA